jgi:ribosome-associated protein
MSEVRNCNWTIPALSHLHAADVTIETHSMPTKNPLKQQVQEAILACQDKQAEQVTILELEKNSGAFTDYFVMCSGTNPRQIQAIADAVDERLEQVGMRVTHREGYKQAEWVLLDYVDFVVHVFSEKARQFYDLERLWKSAKRIEAEEFMAKPKKRVSSKSSEAVLEMATDVARKPARKKKA